MKILKIIIRNLNSLKGDWTICFDEEPFISSGFFAITGDTGAGKTTILDAITLGLYGKIHRNQNDIREVMSYNTAEALAEVEFSVKNDTYRAKWAMHRARHKTDGALQGPNRELAILESGNERILATKIREIEDLIIQITGLDFDRFCRSVLLSQGDFAAFLKADKGKRNSLLESITGTEIYSEISKAAFRRNKFEDEQYQTLKQKLENLDLLPEEEIISLTHQIKEKKKLARQLTAEKTKIEKQISWLNHIHNLEEKLELLLENQQEIDSEKATLKEERLKLERSESLEPFRDLFKDRNTHNSALAELNKAQHNEKGQLEKLASQLNAQKELLKSRKLELDKLMQTLRSSQPLWDEADQLAREIETQEKDAEKLTEELAVRRAQYKEIKESLKEFKEKLDKRNADIKHNQEWLSSKAYIPDVGKELDEIYSVLSEISKLEPEIENQKEKIANSKAQLDKKLKQIGTDQGIFTKLQSQSEVLLKQLDEFQIFDETLEGKDLVFAWQDTLYKLKDEIHRTDTQIDAIQKGEKLSQELNQCQKSNSLKQKEKTEAVAELKILEQKKTKTKEDYDYRLAMYQQALKIAQVEEFRDLVEPDKPCPLCGSIHHNLESPHHPGLLERAKKEEEESRKAYEIVVETYQKRIAQNERLHSELSSIKREMDQYQRSMEEIKPLIGEESLEPLKEKLKETKANFIEGSNNFETLKKVVETHKRLKPELELLKSSINNKKQELEFERKSQLNLENNLDRDIKQLKTNKTKLKRNTHIPESLLNTADWSALYTQLKNEVREFSTKSNQIEQDQTMIQTLSERTEEKNQALHKAEKEGAEIKKKWDNLQSNLIEKKEQRKLLVGTESTVTLKKNLEDKVQLAQNSIEHAENKTNSLEKDHAILEARIKDLKTAEIATSKKLQEVEKTLHSLLKEKEIVNIETAEKWLLSSEESVQIRKNLSDFRIREANNLSQIKNVREELTKERSQNKEQEKLEVLTDKVETLQKNIEEALQDLGKDKQKLEYQEKGKQKSKQLKQQLAAQKKTLQRWTGLNELIGQADGKKFSVFAQGLTLQRLVQLANHHLVTLDNGRYRIRKRQGDGLELEMIDTYQANYVRSVHTLSGGETFLVSLALALGLSDLAGKNARIDSLFIDEGFGTLDYQSLEVAINTLESLQSKGKLIGIISHVPQLKERISTQISVKKIGNGFSTVSVLPAV